MGAPDSGRGLLHTPLGAGRLYARTGDCRLWLFDAQAAMLWDLHANGLNAAQLTELVAERFGLAPARVRDSIDNQLRQWRQAGLLDTRPELATCANNNPTLEEATPTSYSLSAAWRLWVADRAVGLNVADAAIRQRLRPWFPYAATEDCSGPVDHGLNLSGHARDWRLSRDGQPVAVGHTLDAALLAILTALTGLACRPAECLLIVHGAGLLTPDRRGLLLVAPGGSGKTTLAAALNADGLALLHDDVVPVDLHGRLLALGTPMALKAGSWPILASRRPELASWPVTQRHDQPVRLLPPLGQAPRNPVAPAALLFPGHRPGAPLLRERLSAEQALQGLVNSETVTRDLSQAKLERLARWVESVPAWSLTYPDLGQGLAGVRAILADTAPP